MKKSTVLSLFAVLLSCAAVCLCIFRVEPFEFTESSINFALTVIIGLLAVAITIITGGVIYSVFSVDRKIHEALDKERKLIRAEKDELRNDLELYATGLQYQISASNYYKSGKYLFSLEFICNATCTLNKIKTKTKESDFLIDTSYDWAIKWLETEAVCNNIKQSKDIKGLECLRTLHRCLYNISHKKAASLYSLLVMLDLDKLIEELEKAPKTKE